MRTNVELLALHAEALFRHDSAGRLRTVNEEGGSVAPIFYLGRAAEGNEWRFRHDVDENLVAELTRLCLQEPVGHFVWDPTGGVEPFREAIARTRSVERVWSGPAFCFPRSAPVEPVPEVVLVRDPSVLTAHFADWAEDVAPDRPFTAYVLDGQAVSICTSVRETGDAHEAGVETAPDFRGRGFAGAVVSAWAAQVRKLDLEPLYSTSWTNEASRAVARKLGLLHFGSDLHFS